MTVKPQTAVAKQQSSPEVAQKLLEIESQLIRKNKFVLALTELMQVAQDNLHDAQVWMLIGLVYTRMAHWQPAIGVLETSLQLDPHNNNTKQLMALALFSVGERTRACHLIDQVAKSGSATSAHWMLRAYLHAHASSDPMQALKVARDWGRRFADPLTRNARPFTFTDRSPRKKLKVGYVSADFREHSVAFFMQPILAHHDAQVVEVHVYSNGPEDGITQQIKPLAAYWHDVQALSDEQMHAQVRADGIDILVDLSGYTHGQRLGVFARRAAPVQVTWLGYMHTLGMKAMDYRLVDAGIAPPSHGQFYSETLFHLNCMATYVPPAYSPLCETLPLQQNGYPTLVSLNSSAKITDAMLRVWGRILEKRTDARLIIMVKEDSPDAALAHMEPRVAAAGLPMERVSVLHQQPLDRFMEVGFIADVALDTFPISGGTTTLHALWMGLPIVALRGKHGVQSSTASTLLGLGLGQDISNNEDEYVAKALAWLEDEAALLVRRQTAREHLQQSILMDYAQRTRDLEQAFRLMWLNYLRQDKASTSVVQDVEQLLQSMECDHV